MNDSVVPVTAIGGFVLLILWSKRFRTKMSSLMTWLLGSVTGARKEEKPAEEISQVATTSKGAAKTDAKQNKKKVRQRAQKVNEEPTFSTKLSTPIEEIIEETLNEEKSDSQSSSQTSEKGVKSKRKGKGSRKEKVQQKSDDEDIQEFTFIKHNQKTSNKNQKEQSSTVKKVESKVSLENSVQDDVGYSFFPVKEKIRKGKGKSLLEKKNSEEALTAVIAQGITKKKDLLTPSIIEHYQNKNQPLRNENSAILLTGSSQDLVSPNQEQPKLDLKESKKVTSKVSYASIVTNSVPADFKFEESFKSGTSSITNDTVTSNKLDKEISSSIEVLSQYSEDSEEISEKTHSGSVTAAAADEQSEDLSTGNLKQTEILPVIQTTNENNLESSVEIIQTSTEFEQKTIDVNPYPDANGLCSIEKTSESFKESSSYNFIRTHFEQSQNSEYLETKTVNEEYSLELNDQVLKDVVDQLVDEEEPEFQEDLEHITQEQLFESDQYLEQNLVSCSGDISSNEELISSIENTANRLVESANVEVENTEILGISVQTFVEPEEKFNQNNHSTVEDFITAKVEHNVLTQQAVEAISVEQINPQHSSQPVKEENLCSKSVYYIIEDSQGPDKPIGELHTKVDTKDQVKKDQENIESYIEDQLQSLEDQIIEKPFTIEETEINVSDINSDKTVSEDSVKEFPDVNHKQSDYSLFSQENVNQTDEIKDIQEAIEELNTAEEISFQQNTKSVQEDFFYVEKIQAGSDYHSEPEELLSQLQSQIEESDLTEKDIEKQSGEIYIEDQIQNLEDEIIEKPFTIEETEIIVSDCSAKIPTVTFELLTINSSQQDVVDLNPVEQVIEDIEENLVNSNEELTDLKMAQLRVLTLNDKEHQESTIYRIEKQFILQFRFGPSLFGRRIKLYCNYPREVNGVLQDFNRDSYQLLNWCQDEGCKNADDTASFAQIVAKIAGSFHYYFIYDNENTEERQGSGYFIVDPVLKYGANEELPLDCIQCQTVLAKHLGPFSTWENKLRVAKESGYNVIHFTPIQELGPSKSCYSLSEQLKINPMFNEENGTKPTFEDMEQFTSKMRKEWKVLSVCDIVLNHTANESEWIREHPEATYNCVNCSYMRPAYLLDAAFHQFSMEVKKGFYEDRGIPIEVSTEDHLNAIRYHFKLSTLEPLKIQELFTVDVNKCLEQFLTLARKSAPIDDNEIDSLPEIKITQDPEFKRLGSTVDLNLALRKYNRYRLDSFDEESRIKRCAEDLKVKLESLNEIIIKEVTDDLNVAVENVIAGIRYFRVQADGPKIKEITINNPLVFRYFTDYGFPKSIKEHEEIMYGENGKFLMAHNGWVMNSDPLKNFADVGTKTYIRRELIAWGDSVKLRFGNKPEDSPFLWDYMRKYVEQTVKIFDGVRLDNCHSTPIPVAEYLLDCARKIRPDLYVVAELFTNSDLTDNIFVNRLGITSLIREAMSAWDCHEEGRLVYRYGGVPVGSFYQPNVQPLVPMVAHALFLDLTHDNPSPVEKRSVFDLLPSTALVNMACCASGSNRGYDELVPHHIHVVDETRQYTEWSDDESLTVGNVKYLNDKFGIIAAKRALNDLHFKLGTEGYNQVYVDQIDSDIVAVTRHNPETHTSYVLVAFTAFNHPDVHAGSHQRGIKPLRVEGVLDEIVLEASLSHINEESGGSRFSKFENFTKDTKWINGLTEYHTCVKQHIQINQSDVFEEANSGSLNVIQLNFKNFKPGSVAVIKVSLPEEVNDAVLKIRSLISKLSVKKGTELTNIINKMTLADLNRALYRCDQEERDEGNGSDIYNIPNYGPMVYSGLQGFMSLLANIRPSNDLGHPFCANLRDGNWMIEYIWKRLKVDEGTRELGQWIEENTKYLHSIPRYLIPCYFDVIVTGIYIGLLEQSYKLMSNFVKHGSTFVRGLALGSLQFGGYVRSADLPVLSPNLAEPKPPAKKNKDGKTVQACITLSAGLPHFSVGYMRNWGRDTFIALRGLFILTGRFEEARQHILGYAACLRHGLIPNLLDGGRNPRFNCRDAVWWWLYCIKSYCEEASNGTAILSDVVSRIFPTDDSASQLPGAVDRPLHDVIQEALKVHFQGLRFRERNAGRQIDEHMTDAGFNNQIGIHPETGFIFGGNQWNCGTWMDKMGSSDKAGNRGKPATPRDGSAVELVGLSKAAISWLWKLHKEGKYPYDSVERTHKNGAITKWTFKEWADKIQSNFEKKFWVGVKPSTEENRPDLVNKKNIYKDSFGASQPWTDYQLRCNFPIAMVAAPELFDPQHAWLALEQAEKYLLGPLGMKTLDPEDWNYRGDYDNSNDSSDFNTSHGFNYHQGPEWLWPIGLFLRAKLIFAAQNGMLKETLASTKVILSRHFTELQTSSWRGLPELTNSNGAYCRDSSRTQAWSMSCVLEVLYDLQHIESKQIVVN